MRDRPAKSGSACKGSKLLSGGQDSSRRVELELSQRSPDRSC